MTGRVHKILLAVDELGNALLGGLPRETVSGTVGRAAAKGSRWAIYLAAPFLDFLFGKRHCAQQAIIEAARRAADEVAP